MSISSKTAPDDPPSLNCTVAAVLAAGQIINPFKRVGPLNKVPAALACALLTSVCIIINLL
jgi:hypothetical protein